MTIFAVSAKAEPSGGCHTLGAYFSVEWRSGI
jgi:hypothetical protein